MTRHWVLALCATAVFLTVIPTPTPYVKRLPAVLLRHSVVIPDVELTRTNQLPDDWETQKFIAAYLRHGNQYDPRLNGELP
jgi:hypothetical protein